MQPSELQNKIQSVLDNSIDANEWDSLLPTDENYLLYSPKPVGYHSTAEQHYIFQNLLVGYDPSLSILDIGCGRADLSNFINDFYGQPAIYHGIDHNPLMAQLATDRYSLEIQTNAFETAELPSCDWVVASGLFTQRRCNDENEDLQKLFSDVHLMYNAAKTAVSFNLLSPINNTLHEGFFYTHPGLIMDMMIEKYRYVSVRHNYSNDVYTVTIYKINS
jgi:SAM-dependent methyltransferase